MSRQGRVQEALLALVRPGATGGAARLLRDFSPEEYAGLLRLAVQSGVAPFLYRNLQAASGLRPEFIEGLRNAYLCTFRDNVLHSREMLRIVGLLRDNGIEAIPLKGSLASDLVFGEPGLYPTGDIDILIRPQDLDRARKALAADGYSSLDREQEDDLLSAHYHIIFHNSRYVLEVHWNLVMRYCEVAPGFWWEGKGAASYEGVSLPVLSPEKYLLYSVFRLFAHGFRPLRFLLFPAALIRRYGINWDGLLSQAEGLGLRRLTLFVLCLLSDTLDAGIPAGLLRQKSAGYRLLRYAVLSGLFREESRIHLRMLLYLFLLDSPRAVMKVAARRVFPDAAELRLRYGLPAGSRRLYLYYLLNPFLLMLRKR